MTNESTPEEKLREFYAAYLEEREITTNNEYLSGVVHGVGSTLEFLGIKIPGVNEEVE